MTDYDTPPSHHKNILLNESYRISRVDCMNYCISFRIDDMMKTAENTLSNYRIYHFSEEPIRR
jgi:hypothetical protein